MAKDLYTAKIYVNRSNSKETDTYGKVLREASHTELASIEIRATTLEELQTKVTAHTQLVSDL